MATRLPALLDVPIGFGHRGAMARARENTIESFELAVAMGATGVESDAWVTADGIAVLDHDGVVGPRLRRKPLASLPRRELPDHIPTLAELYDTVGTDYPISLDVQTPEAFEAVLRAASEAGGNAEANLWLCTPDLAAATDWRPRTAARIIHSTRLQALDNSLERHAAELAQRAIDGLNLPHRDWSGGRVTLLHRFGLLALGWGAEWEREVSAVIDVGIDAVYSDHVDRMMAVIAEYYGRTGADGRGSGGIGNQDSAGGRAEGRAEGDAER